MEVLLDKSPRRVPKWYFHFNLFLIGVLSVCLSCFFPVIIDEVIAPENTEDNFTPEQKLLPAAPNTEEAPMQKVAPEEKGEDKPKKESEATPTMPLNYAATQVMKEQRFNHQHIDVITKTESIPFYAAQHDIVNNESPANITFMDKKAGQISQQATRDIANKYNNLNTNKKINPPAPIASINATTLEGNHNEFEVLNTEINSQKNNMLTFGVITGAGIHMGDQAFEQPTTMALAAGAYAHIPVKGRWGINLSMEAANLSQGRHQVHGHD